MTDRCQACGQKPPKRWVDLAVAIFVYAVGFILGVWVADSDAATVEPHRGDMVRAKFDPAPNDPLSLVLYVGSGDDLDAYESWRWEGNPTPGQYFEVWNDGTAWWTVYTRALDDEAVLVVDFDGERVCSPLDASPCAAPAPPIFPLIETAPLAFVGEFAKWVYYAVEARTNGAGDMIGLAVMPDGEVIEVVIRRWNEGSLLFRNEYGTLDYYGPWLWPGAAAWPFVNEEARDDD